MRASAPGELREFSGLVGLSTDPEKRQRQLANLAKTNAALRERLEREAGSSGPAPPAPAPKPKPRRPAVSAPPPAAPKKRRAARQQSDDARRPEPRDDARRDDDRRPQRRGGALREFARGFFDL